MVNYKECLQFMPNKDLPGSREGTGGSDLPEKSQNLGFLSNTGQDPLKNHKDKELVFNVDSSSTRHRNAI